MQQVNYKSDPTTVNEDFLVKLPDKETGDMKPISQNLSQQAQKSEEPPAQPAQPAPVNEQPQQLEQTAPSNPNIYIPQDGEVKKRLFRVKILCHKSNG